MPTDFPYTFAYSRVWQGAGHVASRAAVLWPLVHQNPLPPIAQAYARLQELWRNRVWALNKAGWTATAATRNTAILNITYLRNCPPFGTDVTPRKGRPCNRARVCPMCYARRVVLEAYKALERAFYVGYEEPVLRHVRVVSCVRKWEAAVEPRGVGGWLEKAQVHRWADANRVEERLGSVVAITLAPSQAKGMIMIRRATLLAVPDRVRCAVALKAAGGTVRSLEPDKLTKATLARLLGKALAYPAGMMYGDPQLAAKIANIAAEGKIKTLATAGILKNRPVVRAKEKT